MATPAPPEDQVRLLGDALDAVRHQTGLMRKCLDMPGKLMDALKCWYVMSSCYLMHLGPGTWDPTILSTIQLPL